MKLLRDFADHNYPTYYLLSRVRGRRQQLIDNWARVLSSPEPYKEINTWLYGDFITGAYPEGIWNWFTHEFHWVFSQMNRKLQNLFLPFIVYFEIEQTLLPCMRYKLSADTGDKIALILSKSLLSGEITDSFKQQRLADVLERLETCLRPVGGGRSLRETYLNKGLRTLEQTIVAAYLEHAVFAEINNQLRVFFVSLIDLRNTVMLYKHIRWKIASPPVFITGGTLSIGRLTAVFERRDISLISDLVSGLLSRGVVDVDPSEVERELLKAITRQMRRNGQEPLGTGVILDYLWRCFIQALNIRSILYGHEMAREVLADELIH